MNLSALRPDDRFDLIVEHRRAATGEIEAGKLLYAGLDRVSGKDIQLMPWSRGGQAQWFESSAPARSAP